MGEDMEDKKFSIIVATKDRPESIKDFLISLRDTEIISRKDVEVIIVDNNSKYGQIKNICKIYRAIYYKECKLGKSYALNKGIELSKGRYLIFTDDDIVIKNNNWLNQLYRPFEKMPKLGYVSGNILAFNRRNAVADLWEKKGGLSKGSKEKYFSKELLSKFRFIPWPLTKICAGANCIIPKKVLLEVGGYNPIFGPGGRMGHGESLLIGYEIIKKGYELYYNPEAIVYHKHPTDAFSLKRKLFLYGMGDTGIHAFIFAKYKDFRSLFWGIFGHPLYTIKNLVKSVFKRYALPPSYAFHSFKGSLIGFWKVYKIRKSLNLRHNSK